jgi:hypothetical protein
MSSRPLNCKARSKYATASELQELLSAFRSQQGLIAADVVLTEIRSRKLPEPIAPTVPVSVPSVPVQSKAGIEKAARKQAERDEIRRVRIESQDGRVIPRCKDGLNTPHDRSLCGVLIATVPPQPGQN